jgi:hypothetical protein
MQQIWLVNNNVMRFDKYININKNVYKYRIFNTIIISIAVCTQIDINKKLIETFFQAFLLLE